MRVVVKPKRGFYSGRNQRAESRKLQVLRIRKHRMAYTGQ